MSGSVITEIRPVNGREITVSVAIALAVMVGRMYLTRAVLRKMRQR